MGDRVAQRRGVLFDYAGVLTCPVDRSFAAFERAYGIERGRVIELLVEASRTTDGGIIGALEVGRLPIEEFEEALKGLLASAGYTNTPSGGLLKGLFEGMTPEGGLWSVALQIRAHGHRTALVSNSWGTAGYPRRRLAQHFDATVISGEVGVRKPDPAIYRHACDAIGVAPEFCAFVDDLEHNVEVARKLGMLGIVHTGDDAATARALSGYLDLELLPGDSTRGRLPRASDRRRDGW